jgi:hypothetical protein
MMMPFIWTLSHRCHGIEDDTIEDFDSGFLRALVIHENVFGCGKGEELSFHGSIHWFAYLLFLIALANLLITQLAKTFDRV